jgi:alanyl-tRNA synthetase
MSSSMYITLITYLSNSKPTNMSISLSTCVVRYGMQVLGAPAGFFTSLAPVVAQEFGEHYPELREKQVHIQAALKDEEEAFACMLERGVKYFNDVCEELVKNQDSSKIIPGERAFYLYDSLGFPLDLTQLMASERGFRVDSMGFDACMEAQRQRSRHAQSHKRLGGVEGLMLAAEQTSFLCEFISMNELMHACMHVCMNVCMNGCINTNRMFAHLDVI